VYWPREAIRLYDVFHDREETSRSGWLYPALIMMIIVVIVVAAARHGRTRADVTRARRATLVRTATVLLTYPLADAQPLHELRPSVEGGLVALLLLLLRRGMLCLPVGLLKGAAPQVSKSTWLKSKEQSRTSTHLENHVFVLFSHNDT